jgi:hypothetical protein
MFISSNATAIDPDLSPQGVAPFDRPPGLGEDRNVLAMRQECMTFMR